MDQADQLRAIEADLASLLKAKVATSFETWCRLALAPVGQEPARHHLLLIRELQRVADTPDGRLMVLMPPGSAKSTYVSVLFAAWWMARYPTMHVIAASATADIARPFSRKVQAKIRENSAVLGTSLANEAVDLWHTTGGAQYRAAGVGGVITSFRGGMFLIDDPVSGQADADSETQRNTAWEWYQGDVTTRLLPGARMVMVLTRWHEDDLAGRALKAEPGLWRVLKLPALAETDDPLGRLPGEPLWPEWEGAKALAVKRKTLGERKWAALFQQAPSSAEGSIIKREWWRCWEHDAREMKALRPDFIIMSVDGAYTAQDQNDASACTIWYVTTDYDTGRAAILLRYAWRERLEFPELLSHIDETAAHFGKPRVPLTLLIENKGPGLSLIQEMRRRRPEMHIVAFDPKRHGGGDKVARAHAVTSLLEGGAVSVAAQDVDGAGWLPTAPCQMVIDECAAFPVAAHDDLCDSVTQALKYIRDMGLELMPEDVPPLPTRYREQVALY